MDQAAVLGQKIIEAGQIERPAARLAELASLRQQMDVLIATETAALDGKGAFEGRSYRSPASFLCDEVRVAGGVARDYLRVGRSMRKFPALLAAAESGEVSYDHLRSFSRIVAGSQASEEQILLAQAHEQKFLDKAKAYTCDDFAALCKQWRSIANQDDPDTHARVNAKIDVSYVEHEDGETAELKMVGPKIDVLAVRKAMTRIADQMWRKEKREADANVRPMRHNAARKFAAMVKLANRAVATIGRDDVIEPEPLTTIVVDWKTFENNRQALADGKVPYADAVFRADFRAETGDGIPISPGQGYAAALAGRIRRIVFGGKSRKVDLGRAERFFVRGAREAVATRDRTCQGPGCDMPARWCDVDHITDWQHGGHTNPQNGQLLCRYHHSRKPSPLQEAA